MCFTTNTVFFCIHKLCFVSTDDNRTVFKSRLCVKKKKKEIGNHLELDHRLLLFLSQTTVYRWVRLRFCVCLSWDKTNKAVKRFDDCSTERYCLVMICLARKAGKWGERGLHAKWNVHVRLMKLSRWLWHFSFDMSIENLPYRTFM